MTGHAQWAIIATLKLAQVDVNGETQPRTWNALLCIAHVILGIAIGLYCQFLGMFYFKTLSITVDIYSFKLALVVLATAFFA